MKKVKTETVSGVERRSNRIDVCIMQDGESMMLLIPARQTFTSGGMYCTKQKLPNGRTLIRRFPLVSIREASETLPLN